MRFQDIRIFYGAVIRYGSVRFAKNEILRCGSVRFSEIRNLTVRGSVRFSHIVHSTVWFGSEKKKLKVWFGAVFRNQEPYSARFGAVFTYRTSYGVVRCCDNILRCGLARVSVGRFVHGTVPIALGKTVQRRFFSTVHRMNKAYKTVSDSMA